MDETQPKQVQLQHGAPTELWELEMRLSNLSSYAMTHHDQASLAREVSDVKRQVRDMIRAYGYKGPF